MDKIDKVYNYIVTYY